jgi:hypothetical protein
MAMDSIEIAFEQEGGHTMPKEVADGVVKQVGQGGYMVVSNMMRWVFYGGLEKAWTWVPDQEIRAH